MQQSKEAKRSLSFKWIERLSPEQRAELAKKRIRKVADQISALLHLHESNSILIYSNSVTSKIPRSFAAHTYNLISDCLFGYQLIRLCALWDNPSGEDRASLPVVAELIRNKMVRKILANEKCNWHLRNRLRNLNPSSELEVIAQQINSDATYQIRSAQRDAKNAIRSMLKCIKEADEIHHSSELKTLKAFRDNHIAHCLLSEKTTTNARSPITFGQEELLLEKTLALVAQFALDITGTHYTWEEYSEQHRRCATELWGTISFNIDYKSAT